MKTIALPTTVLSWTVWCTRASKCNSHFDYKKQHTAGAASLATRDQLDPPALRPPSGPPRLNRGPSQSEGRIAFPNRPIRSRAFFFLFFFSMQFQTANNSDHVILSRAIPFSAFSVCELDTGQGGESRAGRRASLTCRGVGVDLGAIRVLKRGSPFWRSGCRFTHSSLPVRDHTELYISKVSGLLLMALDNVSLRATRCFRVSGSEPSSQATRE